MRYRACQRRGSACVVPLRLTQGGELQRLCLCYAGSPLLLLYVLYIYSVYYCIVSYGAYIYPTTPIVNHMQDSRLTILSYLPYCTYLQVMYI